jgi:cysteine desulfurase family protein
MDDGHSFDRLIYLDNAATVYPKPHEVLVGALEFYERYGVNPGRSGYDLCVASGDLLQTAREQMCRLFGGDAPDRLCFASNASDALNMLIQGMVAPGDHVVSTVVEHNSVIRPLNHLRRDGLIEVDYVPCGSDTRVDPDDVARAIRPETRLVAVNHASNVTGAVQPVAEIGRACAERGVPLLLDTAQTAGVIPVDMEAMNVSALAFTGHKSLLAPTGIGGVCVREGVEVHSTRYGGTGVRSAHPYHLEEYPYRLEVGTPNIMGVAGLQRAQDWIAEKGMGSIYQHEMGLFARLQAGLQQIDRVRLHGGTQLEARLPVLSFTVDGLDPADVGTFLDVEHEIACRTGLQCAPLIHEQMGTTPRGTVRLSIGPLNTRDHIDAAIDAVTAIVRDHAPRTHTPQD